MTLNSLLQSCTVSYIDIVLISYYEPTSYHEPNYRQIDIEIRNRKDFHDFIDKYGDSIVFDWTIESVDGIPYMIFDLENLVEKVRPSTKEELIEIIEKTIKEQGFECNLNFIDTSLIKDMSYLFSHSQFNGDISEWNVSNVENMEGMFYYSNFNGNIADWDVSKVEKMSSMFKKSIFNGDISKWNVSNVRSMDYMFSYSIFNGDLSNWDVSNVEDMGFVFYECSSKNPPEWSYRKISEYLKHYIDELINEHDDCDLNDLTKMQKEELTLLIWRTASTLKIIKRLSDER